MFEIKVKQAKFYHPKVEVFSNSQYHGSSEISGKDLESSCQKTNGFYFFQSNNNFFEEKVKIKATTSIDIPEEDGVISAIEEALADGYLKYARDFNKKNKNIFLCNWAKAFKVDILRVGNDVEIITTIMLASSFKEEGVAKLDQCLKEGIEIAKTKIETDQDAKCYTEFLAEFTVI